MKLHRWQLQEPTYALCQWIFGSTEELDREALASALNKDPFLANHGISVEIVWHKLEIVPQEDTFGQRAVHAAHISAAPPNALLPVKLLLMLSLPQAKKRAFPWTPSFNVSKTLALIMSACCQQKIKLALPHFRNCTANKFRTRLNLLSSTPTC